MNKLILVGYMGSGKSFLGDIVSKKLEIPFFDLDNIIENRTKMSINELFSTKGELYFRKLEHEIFSELINQKKAAVISTGGGTPCYYNNHLLLQNQTSIYLKASIDLLVERLNNSNDRPILANIKSEELHEFIAKQLFERSFYYLNCNHVLNIDNKPTDDLVSEILKCYST